MSEDKVTALTRDLLAARALIENPEHWTKHPKGMMPMCAYAAVLVAVQGHQPTIIDQRTVEAQRFLAKQVGGDYTSRDVIGFNDHPDTTHADVLALFDRAIASSREAANPS